MLYRDLLYEDLLFFKDYFLGLTEGMTLIVLIVKFLPKAPYCDIMSTAQKTNQIILNKCIVVVKKCREGKVCSEMDQF